MLLFTKKYISLQIHILILSLLENFLQNNFEFFSILLWIEHQQTPK